MKLYVYISESKKLSDLVPITEASRAYNAAKGITGVFCYNHGYYFQVIEGEDDDVENLVKNIWVDKRHQNICEILDVEIDERFFTDWSMNLIPLLKRNEAFLTFVECVKDNINFLSRQQRSLMKLFCELDDSAVSSSRKAQPLSPLKYSISEWPNGDVINSSSSLLSLCGTLMNNPIGFKALAEQKMHGSREEIRSMLNELNKSGFLKVTQEESVNQESQFEHLHKVQRYRQPRSARVA